MIKIVSISLLILVIGAISFFVVNNYIYTSKQGEGGFQSDYKNSEYIIEGKKVQLINGEARTQSEGSAAEIITRYFGNEVEGDLNEDGVSDIAFLLTQQTGGSGTFYYVVAALKTDAGYEGTSAFLLGDRIAPQTTEYRNGTVVVNYSTRKEGEPMAAQPSVGVSKYLSVSGKELVEVN